MSHSAASALQAIQSNLQANLNSLKGRKSDYIATLPEKVQNRLSALKNLYDKNAELEKQYRDEVLELKKKFAGLHAPLYEKRRQIIAGDHEPSKEEYEREPDSDDEEEGIWVRSTEELKGIPEFWLTLFMNHPNFSEIITENDELALKHLTDISSSFLEQGHGFKLVFQFDENEFFANKTLTKTYYLSNLTENGFNDVVFDRAEGCKIDWKEGKNLTVKVESVTQRHKTTKKTRVVKKEVPQESFFSFFTPPVVPVEESELTDEEFEELEYLVQEDFAMGEIIREKLIPNAVNWFTGKALENEEFDDDEEFDEDDYFDDEEDDEDVIEEEDEDDDEAAPAQNPPECKQQ